MDDGIEERLSAGLEARREQRGAGEVVGRLQRQVDGLYAERRHFAGRVDQLRANLDRLEAKSRSWFGSRVSRNLDEQLDLARLETYEAEDRLDDVERRFEAARTALDEARDRQETIEATSSDYEAALEVKEQHLLDAGDPRAERLRGIAADLERQAAVRQELDDLLTSVGWSDRALDTLEHLLGNARSATLADLAGGGVLASKAKYDEIEAVNRAATYAEQCLAKLADELRVYGERRSLHTGLQTDSRTKLLDLWMDSGYGDAQSFLELMKTQQRLPRTRSLLQQVGEDLRLRRAEILTALVELTADRQRLLAQGAAPREP